MSPSEALAYLDQMIAELVDLSHDLPAPLLRMLIGAAALECAIQRQRLKAEGAKPR